jgi:hypothetical protein
MMTVPPQLTSSLPSFSYPASFRHPPPASSLTFFYRVACFIWFLLTSFSLDISFSGNLFHFFTPSHVVFSLVVVVLVLVQVLFGSFQQDMVGNPDRS